LQYYQIYSSYVRLQTFHKHHNLPKIQHCTTFTQSQRQAFQTESDLFQEHSTNG
jgi:hypothetical protein